MASSNPPGTHAPDLPLVESHSDFGSSTAAMAVAGLHVVGCGLFAMTMATNSDHALSVAAGLTAYLLGVRHAFDADHIAAIDNTTRYLRAWNRPARTVGFWFSLGHSAVVFLACVLLGVGWQSLAAHISGRASAAGAAASVWGPAVSGSFLLALAALNAHILVRLWRDRGLPACAEIPVRGFVTRLMGEPWTISRPRRMVAVGFLFGLGFDTATSVGILLLGAGVPQSALSWTAFVALPVLFAAGMTLFDSVNGVAMHAAYGWADAGQRRIYYNLVVTAVSVMCAGAVGVFTLANLVGKLT